MAADAEHLLERSRDSELDAIELRINAWARGAPKTDEEMDRLAERLDAIIAESREDRRERGAWSEFLKSHPELDDLREADDGR